MLIRGEGGRGRFQWHMGAKVEAKATEANVLGFVAAEEAHFPDAELPENLRTHPEFTVAHDLGLGWPFICHARGVGMPAQIHQGAASLLGEELHGLLKEAPLESVQVLGKGFHVHADQGRFAPGQIPQEPQSRARTRAPLPRTGSSHPVRLTLNSSTLRP